MLNSVVRWWRVFGTGVSFFAVGVGGVLVFPVLNIVIQKTAAAFDARASRD